MIFDKIFKYFTTSCHDNQSLKFSWGFFFNNNEDYSCKVWLQMSMWCRWCSLKKCMWMVTDHNTVVILQIWNREKFWLCSVILKRSDSLLEYCFYISYVKQLLPEHENGRSGRVLGDNFSHVSLQDDPCNSSSWHFVSGELERRNKWQRADKIQPFWKIVIYLPTSL